MFPQSLVMWFLLKCVQFWIVGHKAEHRWTDFSGSRGVRSTGKIVHAYRKGSDIYVIYEWPLGEETGRQTVNFRRLHHEKGLFVFYEHNPFAGKDIFR